MILLNKNELQLSMTDEENKKVREGQELEEKEKGILRRYWINIILFLATIISTLFAGAFQITGNFRNAMLNLNLGAPFSFSIMFILLSHELGHYFASRYHKIPSTLPYFLPVPHPLVGTFGAFIKMKGRIMDRNALIDIGSAGPFAGLVASIPILIIGLKLSTIVSLDSVVGKQIMPTLGSSILFRVVSYLVKGYIPPEMGIELHPMAYAAWISLWVTSINLIPMGQLDGGHVSYALFGKKSIWIARGFFVTIMILGIFWMGWLFWGLFTAFIIRFYHPSPVRDDIPLDRKRKFLGIMAILLLVFTFLPVPFFE
ncbi:MAG: site-2 protease family protein [bacterium]